MAGRQTDRQTVYLGGSTLAEGERSVQLATLVDDREQAKSQWLVSELVATRRWEERKREGERGRAMTE